MVVLYKTSEILFDMSLGIKISKRMYLLVTVFLVGIIVMSFFMKSVVEGWTQTYSTYSKVQVTDDYTWANTLSNTSINDPNALITTFSATENNRTYTVGSGSIYNNVTYTGTCEDVCEKMPDCNAFVKGANKCSFYRRNGNSDSSDISALQTTSGFTTKYVKVTPGQSRDTTIKFLK